MKTAVRRKEIVTERLRLGALRVEDAPALIAMLSDPEVGKTYMVPDLDSEEKQSAVFERLKTLSASERFVYGIFLEERLIGMIHSVGGEGREIELGYFISPAEKGRGYASEALKAAVAELFSMGCPRVVAGAFEENPASLRVMEKCGFTRIERTEAIEYRGKTHNCIFCAIEKPHESMAVCGRDYGIIRLLGHGKGGYSYLAESGGQMVVIKQIHHEPCDYYSFGNKIEAEIRDFSRLKSAAIRIPEMLAADVDSERIVKEYIDGPTVLELVRSGASVEAYLPQVREMALKAKAVGMNIDYFPTNFVVCGGMIWYVDYECSEYSDEWSFENWGVKYWSDTPELKAYLDKNG